MRTFELLLGRRANFKLALQRTISGSFSSRTIDLKTKRFRSYLQTNFRFFLSFKILAFINDSFLNFLIGLVGIEPTLSPL